MLVVGENRLAVCTVAPVISGTAEVGSELTCATGVWSRYGTISYQWYRDEVAISGATSNAYTLVEADAGAGLCCYVTNSSGTGANATTHSNHLEIADNLNAPIVADQTIEFGKLTLAGKGGVHLVSTGGDITGSTTNTLTGVNADHWAISADGEITPTANFEASPQNSYSLTATVYNDGGSDTATITISCSGNDANGFDLATGYSILPDELDAALDAIGAASSGARTVFMRTGDYLYSGDFSGSVWGNGIGSNKRAFTNTVTLTAHDGASPVIDRAKFEGTNNVTFDGLEFYYGAQDVSGGEGIIQFTRSAGNITITNCTIHGYPLDASPSADYSSSGSYLNRPGIVMSSSLGNIGDITISGNSIYDVKGGIGGQGDGNLVISDNDIYRVYEDGINIANSTAEWASLEISGNRIRQGIALPSDAGNPHVDHLQIVIWNDWTGVVTIENNIIWWGGTRASGQGMLIRSGSGFVLDGGTIQNNLVESVTAHGISLLDATNCTFTGNTCTTTNSDVAGLTKYNAAIRCGTTTDGGGNTVSNNVAEAISGGGSTTLTNNVVLAARGVTPVGAEESYTDCFDLTDEDPVTIAQVKANYTRKTGGPLDTATPKIGWADV